MRGLLLGAASVALTSAVIGNAYMQKEQFYPTVVYLIKSNPSMAALYLQAVLLIVPLYKIIRKIFFGQLRASEIEHLMERSWHALIDTCLAFTLFREDFSPQFVAIFSLLLFIKCFHWLAEDRIDFMERSPNITWLFHIRAVSLGLILLALDGYFMYRAYTSVMTQGASVQLVFGFEYAIMAVMAVANLTKYLLHAIDLASENPWENKAVYLLYSEVVLEFVRVVLYSMFMFFMTRVHTAPLFAVRPMYMSIRHFRKCLNDVILSRRAIANMNTLYANATAEDLAAGDSMCIICREDMQADGGAKRLPCSHIFHTACLRSWFQRQRTCPTCRTDVLRNVPPHMPVPGERGPAGAPQQRPAAPQQGQFVPPPFPMWPGMPQPPMMPPPQPPTPAQTPASTASNGTTTSAAAPGTSTNTTASGAAGGIPSMPGFPSFAPPGMGMPPFFPPPPPPPPFMFGLPSGPPPSIDHLTLEQLQQLEGQERQNVEARIQLLRNIQRLLDTAVEQMGQYYSISRADSAPVPTSTSQVPSSTQPSELPIPSASQPTMPATETQRGTLFPVPTQTADVHSASPAHSASPMHSASPAHSASPDKIDKKSEQEKSAESEGVQSEVRQRRLEWMRSTSLVSESSTGSPDTSEKADTGQKGDSNDEDNLD